MTIRTDKIADFLMNAIEAYRSNAERELGCSISNVEILENGDPHAYLSDGSRFHLEIHHLVPRGYFDAEYSRDGRK